MSDIQKESLFSQIQESDNLKIEKTEGNQLKTDDFIEESEKIKKFIRVESLVFPKENIAQALNSVSFPSNHPIAKNELFEIGANILQSFGIVVHEYPYAFSEFFIKGWKKSFEQKENPQKLTEKMLTMIEAARLSKIIIKDYFNFVIKTLQNSLTKSVSSEQTIQIFTGYSNSVLETCSYLTESNKNHIFETHFRLVFEDNFAISLAYTCLNNCSKALMKITEDWDLEIQNIINFIDKHINIDELFKVNNAPYVKILIRSWLLKDLNCMNNIPFCSMASSIKTSFPVNIELEDFFLFSSIINTTTMKQAIDLFVENMLNKDNQTIESQNLYKIPFRSHDEGLKMIFDAFEYAVTSGKTFYADLLSYAHGFSDDGYIFIQKSHQTKSYFDESFRLLTLIHESMHLYKYMKQLQNLKMELALKIFLFQTKVQNFI